MGIVGRMIQPGVTISVHARPPRGRGDAELGRSRQYPAAAFSEGPRYAKNMPRLDVPVVRQGMARYVAVWIEGHIEAVGELDRAVVVEPGRMLWFPRGMLRLEMG